MPATINVAERLPNRLVIGADFLDHASGGQYEHVNPATGHGQRTLPMAGPEEVDRAVAAARGALAEWRLWRPAERRRVLLRFADLITANLDDLAATATLETGTPLTQTPYVVQWAVDWLQDAAGWADKLYGQTTPVTSSGMLEYSLPEPYGVVAVIATWNGSIGGFGMSAAAPLAAGCTVVVKPSELAPFGMIRAAELALEAGIPPGVINVITADAQATSALVTHDGIDKIVFTGSPPTARKIAAAAAEVLTPCVFELGGKSASITFADADLAVAVADGLLLTGNSGQVCTLGSRLLVQRGVLDAYVEQLTAALASVRQGDPFEAETMMGPVINQAACDRIVGIVDRARQYGDVVIGGSRVGGDLADGFFVAPTLVSDVSNESEIAQTELFGPVAAVIPFDDEDEAIAIANDTEYGLAAYLFTADLSRAHRMASRLQAGNVGINGGSAPAGPAMPFGGRKQSGYGKQGGLAGVLEFVDSKTVQVRL
jgi:aldehyde dehydrogenase (NAD+)